MSCGFEWGPTPPGQSVHECNVLGGHVVHQCDCGARKPDPDERAARLARMAAEAEVSDAR